MAIDFKKRLEEFVKETVVQYVVAAGLILLGVPPQFVGTMFWGGVGASGMRALRPEDPPLNAADNGYMINEVVDTGPAAVIYGETRVGGVIFYRETTESNKVLHMLIALAGHEVNAINTVYANDETLTIDGSGNVTAPSRYVGKLKIYKHLGTSTQSADANLVAESTKWTSNHSAKGIAYIYCRLVYDADAYPNGVPTFTAIVQGKKVFDPRDTNHDSSDSSTWSYSNNPALCLRDYLVYAGLADHDEIDDTYVEDAADICDQSVTVNAGTQSRYTTNGSFTLDASPDKVINNLSQAMAGLTWYTQGTWAMKAGSYTSPVFSGATAITADDFRSPIQITTKSSNRDSYNKITGIYRGSETNYFKTSYPTLAPSTFLSEDANVENALEVNLPYTDTSAMAQRISKILLYKNRQDVSFTSTFSLRCLQLSIGDVVEVTYPRLGWDGKTFEVVDWGFALNSEMVLEVRLSFVETSSSVYDFALADETVFIRDNTTLLSPFDVPAVSISLAQEYRVFNESITNALIATISSPNPERVDYVEVEFRKTTDSDFSILGTGDLGKFEILDIETPLATDTTQITYEVKARAISALGVKGSSTTVSKIVAADTTGPSAPGSFARQLSGGSVFLNWTASPDLDLSYYKIHHSSSTSATFTDGSPQVIIQKVARPATSVSYPALSGTFFIEPYDKSGNGGGTSSVIVLPAEIPQLNITTTDTENPSFGGTKTNVAVATGPDPDELRLSSFATSSNSGTYEFTGYIDTGTVRTVRISSNVTATRHASNAVSGSVNWDDIPGNWDTWPSNFNNWTDETAAFGDFSVGVYVKATNDDPSGSPTYGNWVVAAGEVVGRAFKFKAELASTTANISPSISVLEGVAEY